MMISKFNGIVVSNEGNEFREFSFVESNNVRLVLEYVTGEWAEICFRHYDESARDGNFYYIPNIGSWAYKTSNWWIETIHQFTDEGYYHGVVITDGDNEDVIAIITPDNRMHIVGSNEEAIDLS